MRIAIVGSIWISVPPKHFGFGAQENLEYFLAELLSKKGHDVTLFASGDSKTSAKLISACPEQISNLKSSDPKIKDIFELINLSNCYKMAREFDIIHNHLLPYGLLFAPLTTTPTVHTLHHRIYERRPDMHIYRQHKNQSFISISNAQRGIVPSLNYKATVYNGVDSSFYSFKKAPSDSYILFVGRMRKYKGIHSAIHVAKTLGKKLKIVSPLPRPSQADYKETMLYFKKEIEPHLGQMIEHIGLISGEKKKELIKNAKLLLFPVEREEPFGMTVVEAQACGTPTVAYANGSMPEIITDGKTGFLAQYDNKISSSYAVDESGILGLVEATEKIYSMPEDKYLSMREHCRASVEENFTVEKMVDNYEKVYSSLA